MTKAEFVQRRTKAISKMLDSRNEHGIYPTTVCFAELDDLFDELVDYLSPTPFKLGPSHAQMYRNDQKLKDRA